jgi:hypothetical protein
VLVAIVELVHLHTMLVFIATILLGTDFVMDCAQGLLTGVVQSAFL